MVQTGRKNKWLVRREHDWWATEQSVAGHLSRMWAEPDWTRPEMFSIGGDKPFRITSVKLLTEVTEEHMWLTADINFYSAELFFARMALECTYYAARDRLDRTFAPRRNRPPNPGPISPRERMLQAVQQYRR